jgi:8-oxo-dGTP pyrophosphatase MutT (NUDIX family)
MTDHRQPLLDLLDRYRSSGRLTAIERPSLERIFELVEREPRCFERTLLEGHITGSAWILDHRHERCLLTHHKKLGLWLQPGGHADGDPDVVRVATREAREESGIEAVRALRSEIFDVDVHAIPANPKEPAHFHYDVRFLFEAPEGSSYVVSEESHDLAWVLRADVGKYNVDASVVRLAEKWKF